MLPAAVVLAVCSSWLTPAPVGHSAAILKATDVRCSARMDEVKIDDLPRNVKEMMSQLRASVQGSLSARQSRLAVEMPIGFEFGVEGERAKRKGSTRMLSSADISRSDRELARIFVDMFEGTGLKPLILFASPSEAAAAQKLWDAPELEARVQALVGGSADGGDGRNSGGSGTGGTGGFGGGGFGGSGSGSRKAKGKGKGKANSPPSPLTRVPAASEVVVAVAPGEVQLRLLREHCEASGLDKLVILLNARLEAEGEKTLGTRSYFEDGGDGGFQTSYAFLTQPLGVATTAKAPKGDPLVLWRAYPGEWVLARKPAIGAPRRLLTTAENRPPVAQLQAAAEAESPSLLGDLFGR